MLPETRYARAGDVSIAYQVMGSGPRDIIFVPGIVSHVEFFHELPGYTDFLEGLASFSRLIVFDKRGNGLSDRLFGAAAIEERVDDIPAVMEAVGSERAALFGVSEGGPISLLFAATYPERVDALILYETFVRYGGVAGRFEWEPDLHKQFTDEFFRRYGTGWSLQFVGTSRAEELHVQELWGRAERLSNSPGGFRAIYESMSQIDVHAALPSVRASCLVMHAKNGSMFEQHGQYLAEHLLDAQLAALDNVDHFPWFSGQDRIVAEVEEFLTGTRPPVPSDRVLTTLLFIDVVGSTVLAAEMGDKRWRELLQSYYRLVRRQVERFRGIEVNTEGDGFFARFDGPARAVSCAVAIREGVQGLGLQIRAGLHTGEIEFIGDDVTGLAVHIGARVGALAAGGEVLVSRTVKDLVVGSGLQFSDRGSHVLKGIPDAWQLYAVVA